VYLLNIFWGHGEEHFIVFLFYVSVQATLAPPDKTRRNTLLCKKYRIKRYEY
jgi:hypothetical protein